jgi:hypothetical protein
MLCKPRGLLHSEVSNQGKTQRSQCWITTPTQGMSGALNLSKKDELEEQLMKWICLIKHNISNNIQFCHNCTLSCIYPVELCEPRSTKIIWKIVHMLGKKQAYRKIKIKWIKYKSPSFVNGQKNQLSLLMCNKIFQYVH